MEEDAAAGGGAYTPEGFQPHFLLHETYIWQLADGVFEELLLHEKTHAYFLDPSSGYICHGNWDQVCFSQYARDNI